MDFAALPPEINSGRMYAGAGAGSMWAAAAAWDSLGMELSSAAASYRSVVSGLTSGPWLGPSSASMAAAAARYVAWMSTTAEQAMQTANQARSAAAAYEAAFAATVPPPVIAENRALLMSLVATNIFGQNTPAIASTQTQYAEMWAQDATAMYSYAGASAAASTLPLFAESPQNTNPAGVGAQAAAVGQATGTSTACHKHGTLSQFLSTVQTLLQGLASGNPTGSGSGLGNTLNMSTDWLNFLSGLTFIASGAMFVLPTQAWASLPASMVGSSGPQLGASGAAALVGGGAPLALGPGTGGIAAGVGRTEVLAGLRQAGSIGGLSVPQSWASAAPAITRSATALPEPTLLGLPEAELDGLGPGYGGMLPGSLMAAAAGGGGAAGGGWAATRGAGGARRGGTGAQPGGATRTPYGSSPMVIPQVAREAGLHIGTHDQAMWPDQRAQGGAGPSSTTLRDEIDDLRKQIGELAIERDLLKRSLALWARDSIGQ
jgi:PPE-repeat protein